MKKIVKLSLVFIIVCIMMIGHVYAMGCNATIESTKTQFEKNEEFTLNFSISNIQSERGVIALTAVLDYDKNSLTLVKMEGQNSWETPADGASYNSQNGKIAITRGGLGKQNEVVFKMTFKVKPEAKQNLTIALKDVAIADGNETAKFETVKKDITIKEANTDNSSNGGSVIPGTTDNNASNNNNQNSNTNNSNNNNQNSNTNNSNKVNATIKNSDKANSKIPQTGTNEIVIISLGGLGALVALFYAIRMKLVK